MNGVHSLKIRSENLLKESEMLKCYLAGLLVWLTVNLPRLAKRFTELLKLKEPPIDMEEADKFSQ